MSRKFFRISPDMMGLIPSRGLCHAVFLLNRAAHLNVLRSSAEWVDRARRQSTIMATALNLERVAEQLLAADLARLDGSICLSPKLNDLWQQADRVTFLAIARVLLEARLPLWMDAVVSSGGVRLEYVPSDDLVAMQWLGADLAELLAASARRRQVQRESEFALRIGSAAERVVLEAKVREGGQVVHVAKIADFFGYDIEHRTGVQISRIEVKGAVESTADGFFITRNEITKAARYGDEWVLVQVIFRSAIALKNEIAADDVLLVRSVTSARLRDLIPPDTPNFSWVDSARVTPSPEYWQEYPLSCA